MVKLVLFSLLILIFLSGCHSNATATDVDLFQYKNSYVGDNSAVVNTVIHLQGAQHFSGIELKTKEEPYGIVVNYAWSESELNEKEVAINNASYLFTLIQNVDWVTFNFEMHDGKEVYEMTRENLQERYEKELSEIDNEDELNELIQESLGDEHLLN
ncbi:DUF4825 domain-containing protein [Pelagirhabdus alkalitolerans]|nr:DUF4825 domain-containing protein [Pelagirhabdus alkalitolerans]